MGDTCDSCFKGAVIVLVVMLTFVYPVTAMRCGLFGLHRFFNSLLIAPAGWQAHNPPLFGFVGDTY